MKKILQLKRGRIKRERRITNMMNGKTCTITNADLLTTTIWLRRKIQLRKVMGEVISDTTIWVPRGIGEGRGRGIIGGVVRREGIWGLELKVMVKSIITLKCNAANFVTHLACWYGFIRGVRESRAGKGRTTTRRWTTIMASLITSGRMKFG